MSAQVRTTISKFVAAIRHHFWDNEEGTLASTLTQLGLPTEVGERADKYRQRYELRMMWFPLLAGAIIAILVQAILLDIGYVHDRGSQVEPTGRLYLGYLVAILLFGQPIIIRLRRGDRICHAVHTLARTIGDLQTLPKLRVKPESIRDHKRMYRERRRLRNRLLENGWLLDGNMSTFYDHTRRGANHRKSGYLSRWLCWVSEDIDDQDRVDGALIASVDTLRHLIGSTPWRTPELAHPPAQAQVTRPTYLSRTLQYLENSWRVLPLLVPIAAALIGLAKH